MHKCEEIHAKVHPCNVNISSFPRFLFQQLAEKNSISLSEVGKVRIELNQTVNKLEAERKLQTELREKLGDSDRKMSGKN